MSQNKRLTIVISGKKSSGKSTLGRFIAKEYLNKKIGKNRFSLEKKNKEYKIIDLLNNNQVLSLDIPNEDATKMAELYSIKMYSFADPLKRICIDLLGLDEIQCYGTEDDKNSQTHIVWDNLPEEIKEKYRCVKRGIGGIRPRSGIATARDVMEIVATEFLRKIDENCFSRGTYNLIDKDGYSLSIVTDCRFVNEVSMGVEKSNTKVLRLLRNPFKSETESETALDSMSWGEFTKVFENSNLSVEETHKQLLPLINEWFERNGVI